jgi:hypothetical protein
MRGMEWKRSGEGIDEEGRKEGRRERIKAQKEKARQKKLNTHFCHVFSQSTAIATTNAKFHKLGRYNTLNWA